MNINISNPMILSANVLLSERMLIHLNYEALEDVKEFKYVGAKSTATYQGFCSAFCKISFGLTLKLNCQPNVNYTKPYPNTTALQCWDVASPRRRFAVIRSFQPWLPPLHLEITLIFAGLQYWHNTSLNKSCAWHIDGATNKKSIWFL